MSETREEYEMEGVVVAIGGHRTNYWEDCTVIIVIPKDRAPQHGKFCTK